MKKIKLLIAIVLIGISTVAQTTTNTNYYDEYGNKIGSSKGTIIEKREFKYVSQYVPSDLNAEQAFFDRLQAHQDQNKKWIDDLIDWIFTLKTKSDDKEFLNALDKSYQKLRTFDGQNLTLYDDEIRNVELSIKEEIDKCNTRMKELPKQLWESGNANINSGNYKQAIDDFSSLIKISPSVSGAYVYRGISYATLGNFSSSLADLNKYIELKPEDYLGYKFRGAVKRELKDYSGAMADDNRFIELQPENAYGYFERARVKSALGDNLGSIADNTKAINLMPNNSMAYNNRGWDKFQLKKYSEAMLDFNKAIELDPNNSTAFDSRQETKFALNDFKGCIDDCDKALKLDSKLANAWFFRGRCYYKQGFTTLACSDWSKAGELGKTEAYDFIQKYCNK